MTRQGWPPNRDGKDIAALVLMDRWEKHFKGRKISVPSRPTFYDWTKHKDPKISPRNLFWLSDLLEVNARWLGFNEGSMAKPMEADEELQPLLDAWRHLKGPARAKLVREANDLLQVQGITSPAFPFNGRK